MFTKNCSNGEIEEGTVEDDSWYDTFMTFIVIEVVAAGDDDDDDDEGEEPVSNKLLLPPTNTETFPVGFC